MAISTGAALLGSAAIGAVGSMASAKAANKPQTSTTEPWKAQQPYLTYGFEQAKNAYQNASQNPVYQGQRVADLNPYQTTGANQVGSFATGLGSLGANALATGGLGLMRSGYQFGNNAGDIFARASIDPTQQIINNAGMFANNPYADSLITAANRDVVRNLNENQLPSLARSASGTGNTNSTRAGVESAILQRGAADRMADTAANIRGTLFNTGLSMSQNQFNQNLSNMLNANRGLLDAYNQGANSFTMGQQAAGNVFDQSQAAGGVFQNQNQNIINANMQRFNEQRDIPMDLAARYMQTVGGNYGGTQTQTGSSGGGLGGAITGALGGFNLGTGIAGRLGPFGQTPSSGSFGNPYSLSYGMSGGGLGLRF